MFRIGLPQLNVQHCPVRPTLLEVIVDTVILTKWTLASRWWWDRARCRGSYSGADIVYVCFFMPLPIIEAVRATVDLVPG